MRLTTMNLMAAAVVALAAGNASAQTLKADIPFTFHAGGSVMSPGTYKVRHGSSTAKFVILHNTDTQESVLAAYTPVGAPIDLKAPEKPSILFECAGHRCALREVRTVSGRGSYHFDGPKIGSDGDTRIATIPLTPDRAD